jgi:hypothetical protein
LTARAPAHFYVYYRVDDDTAVARAKIGALIAEVEARTGISGRLLARCEDPSTWMEVYEPIRDPGSFARTLAACVRSVGAADVAVDGTRRIECFAALGMDPARSSGRRR